MKNIIGILLLLAAIGGVLPAVQFAVTLPVVYSDPITREVTKIVDRDGRTLDLKTETARAKEILNGRYDPEFSLP